MMSLCSQISMEKKWQVLHGHGRESVTWFPAPGEEAAGYRPPRGLTVADWCSFVYVEIYRTLPRLSGNVLSAMVNDLMIIRDRTNLQGKWMSMSQKKNDKH